MKAVIDTNVLLVANGQHGEVSPECVEACVTHLLAIQQAGTVVIDDGYRILGEYQHKTQVSPPKGVGDVFLKWLLREATRTERVEQVPLTELDENRYAEFPDSALEAAFDPPDRKFVAVANAHPGKPEIWQAADSKWLDWSPVLRQHGIQVRFLCPEDACRFHRAKFGDRKAPDTIR
jgi:hypothetical protein